MAYPDALWVEVIKSIHDVSGGFDLQGRKPTMKGVWANMVTTCHKLHQKHVISFNTLNRSLGNGTSIRFWKDV